jgi:Homeodomain-like domain
MKTPGDVAAMLRLKAAGWGLKTIATELGCSRKTVRGWVSRGEWRPYASPRRPTKLDGLSDWLRDHFCRHAGDTDILRQDLEREKSITVSLHTVERAVAPLWQEFVVAAQPQQTAFEWMRAVLQRDVSYDALHREIGEIPGTETLSMPRKLQTPPRLQGGVASHSSKLRRGHRVAWRPMKRPQHKPMTTSNLFSKPPEGVCEFLCRGNPVLPGSAFATVTVVKKVSNRGKSFVH